MTGAATCAFDKCQAGGVILPGAPRHAFAYVVHDTSRPAVQSYHPGCWAAEHVTGPELARWAPRTETPDLAGRPCFCLDAQGLPCLNVAGPDGWCDACRSHANPAPAVVFS